MHVEAWLAKMRRIIKNTLVTAIAVGLLLYSVILAIQSSDSETIEIAKEINTFIIQYCVDHDNLPTSSVLQMRFPNLNRESGWYFYTDGKTYLKMQYPMKWWNQNAIGKRRLSEFTATVYAYSVDYQCKPGRRAPTPNPSFNKDWRDMAAPAG